MKRPVHHRQVHVTPRAAQDVQELVSKDFEVADDLKTIITALQDAKPLFGFDDHELKGELRGWRACAIGVQTSVTAPRLVYYLTDHDVYIVAAGQHDEANEKAQSRRREKK